MNCEVSYEPFTVRITLPFSFTVTVILARWAPVDLSCSFVKFTFVSIASNKPNDFKDSVAMTSFSWIVCMRMIHMTCITSTKNQSLLYPCGLVANNICELVFKYREPCSFVASYDQFINFNSGHLHNTSTQFKLMTAMSYRDLLMQ